VLGKKVVIWANLDSVLPCTPTIIPYQQKSAYAIRDAWVSAEASVKRACLDCAFQHVKILLFKSSTRPRGNLFFQLDGVL
jgi:hypothetical protein